MAVNPRIIEPPFYDAPLTERAGEQQFSHAWTDYHQRVADKLQELNAGVVDGSDAAAGDVGEYLTATASVGLASNVPADVVTLALTAGDWDVRGEVAFGTSFVYFEAYTWIGLASATMTSPGMSSIKLVSSGDVTGMGNSAFQAGPVRFSVSATTTVYLGAQARFTTGATNAVGVISARRMR